MTLSPEIQSILDIIINEQEGGWQLSHTDGDNDGGWTLAGVTANSYRSYFNKDYSLTEMTDQFTYNRETVKVDIYHVYEMDYLYPLHLDYLPESIRGPLASCAINCGTQTAIKLLQTAIKTPNVDGIMGSTTVAYSKDYTGDLLAVFSSLWLKHYNDIVAAKPEYIKFSAGWYHRVIFWTSRSVTDPAVTSNLSA